MYWRSCSVTAPFGVEFAFLAWADAGPVPATAAVNIAAPAVRKCRRCNTRADENRASNDDSIFSEEFMLASSRFQLLFAHVWCRRYSVLFSLLVLKVQTVQKYFQITCTGM